jgi:hypothetical protein
MPCRDAGSSSGVVVMSDPSGFEDQRRDLGRAAIKAYRWPKEGIGDPDGQSRFYHQCREIARESHRPG